MKRDGSLQKVTIYDDFEDPYQLSPIDYKEQPELFATLLTRLQDKLKEANDVWYRESRIEHMKF
jgi:hypothetical protein